MNDIAKAFALKSPKSTVSLEPILPNVTDMFRVWNRDEIYIGKDSITPTKYRYVPKENDLVWDSAQGWFRVSHVDLQGDLLTTLVPWQAIPTTGADPDDLVLLGPISRYTTEFVLLAIDYSQMPPVATVDNRLQIKGSKAYNAKIFLGNDIGPTGEVISCKYDNSGNIVKNTVDLEYVSSVNGQNTAIRIPMQCNISKNLQDGETATLVVYDKEGGWIPPAYRMVIQNSAFVRRAETGQKYVKGVQLLSPFISNMDPDLLEISVSIRNLASVEFRGRVWYTDNTYKDWPVDGTKMILNGKDSYIASIVGQETSFVLTYMLSSDEQAMMANPGEHIHVDKIYRCRTTEAQGAYAPKLYGYPVNENGWKMKWWLCNLDRQMAYECTDKVELGHGSQAFDPLNYGVKQHLVYAVSLADVDSRYKPVRHVQNIDVTLFQGATEQGTSWTVGFDPGQTPEYGASLYCKLVNMQPNNRSINITSGIKTKDEWLTQLYYNIRPLRDVGSEAKAPEPTHFIIYVDAAHQYRFPINQWDQNLVVDTQLNPGDGVFVKWVKVDTNNIDLQLGVSCLVCKNIVSK